MVSAPNPAFLLGWVFWIGIPLPGPQDHLNTLATRCSYITLCSSELAFPIPIITGTSQTCAFTTPISSTHQIHSGMPSYFHTWQSLGLAMVLCLRATSFLCRSIRQEMRRPTVRAARSKEWWTKHGQKHCSTYVLMTKENAEVISEIASVSLRVNRQDEIPTRCMIDS